MLGRWSGNERKVPETDDSACIPFGPRGLDETPRSDGLRALRTGQGGTMAIMSRIAPSPTRHSKLNRSLDCRVSQCQVAYGQMRMRWSGNVALSRNTFLTSSRWLPCSFDFLLDTHSSWRTWAMFKTLSTSASYYASRYGLGQGKTRRPHQDGNPQITASSSRVCRHLSPSQPIVPHPHFDLQWQLFSHLGSGDPFRRLACSCSLV